MTENSGLLLQSALSLRELLVQEQLSPIELIEMTLKRIEDVNGKYNAIVTLADSAIDDAKALMKRYDSSSEKPLLYGLPVGIKDVTPTRGLRTTFGCKAYADHVPEEDALVVQRIKAAGGIIVGKTNTPEFAAGGNTFNEVFGRTCNPWNPTLSAGGSTGGGAAGLATGMIAFAEGTDLGGSLRIPASFCGVVGLRPTPGLVPTVPSDYLWDTLQSTGPMARFAEDAALMLQAVAGPSAMAPLRVAVPEQDMAASVQRGLTERVRIAYCPDVTGIGIDAEIERVCRQAMDDLAKENCEVDDIEFDLSFGREAFLALRGYWMVAHHYQRMHLRDQFGANLKGNIEAGLKTPAEAFAAAEQARSRIWQKFYHLFQRFDFLVSPCMAVPPFPIEQNYPETIAGQKMETYIDWVAPTFVMSLSGLPVCSVPAGLDSNRLPVGLQITGPPAGESKVLALAKAIQTVRPIALPA